MILMIVLTIAHRMFVKGAAKQSLVQMPTNPIQTAQMRAHLLRHHRLRAQEDLQLLRVQLPGQCLCQVLVPRLPQILEASVGWGLFTRYHHRAVYVGSAVLR